MAIAAWGMAATIVRITSTKKRGWGDANFTLAILTVAGAQKTVADWALRLRAVSPSCFIQEDALLPTFFYLVLGAALRPKTSNLCPLAKIYLEKDNNLYLQLFPIRIVIQTLLLFLFNVSIITPTRALVTVLYSACKDWSYKRAWRNMFLFSFTYYYLIIIISLSLTLLLKVFAKNLQDCRDSHFLLLS